MANRRPHEDTFPAPSTGEFPSLQIRKLALEVEQAGVCLIGCLIRFREGQETREDVRNRIAAHRRAFETFHHAVGAELAQRWDWID